jgi:hypothetical protein
MHALPLRDAGHPALKRVVRALIVLATSTLVVCGVKGSPRPPAPDVPDAGAADGGAR